MHRIKGLDGLRGVAVTLVFIEHFVTHAFGFGSLGVRIFFVLSGFLIIGILRKQREAIEAQTTIFWTEFKKFWERRIRRIFPVYYIVLLAFLVRYLLQSKGINNQGLLWYLSFLGNFYMEKTQDWGGTFGHLWSLSVEQHFYMLASPILLFIASRYYQKVFYVVLAISLSVAALNFLNANVNTAYLSSPVNFGFMAMGGLIAIDETSLKDSKKSLVYMAVLLLLAYVYLSFNEVTQTQYSFLLHFIAFVVCISACASLVKYVVNNQFSFLVYGLEYAPLKKLGEISYGFYIFHWFVPSVPTQLHSPVLIALWPLVQYILAVIAAWLSWTFFEQRFLKKKSHSATSIIAAPSMESSKQGMV